MGHNLSTFPWEFSLQYFLSAAGRKNFSIFALLPVPCPALIFLHQNTVFFLSTLPINLI